MKRLVKLGLLLLLFSSCKSQPARKPLIANADDNSLLWEISGRDIKQPSYLFGTFHLMCKSDIVFSEQLKQALGYADTVYMEMDMDDPSTMLGGMMFMNMKNGRKLADLFSPEEYKFITGYFKDTLHMSLDFFQSTKPFFLEAMLYPSLMPCKNFSGVEEELMKLAKAGKKEIKGFETIQFQASVFDSIPYEEQAKELIKTIREADKYKAYFDTMTTVYKSQQLKEIENMFKDSSFDMGDHQDILLDDRNANWVNQLKQILPRESVFIAVGAGHLVGDKGLVSLLKKEGYTVRPLLNK